eukprot:TRINITY_DN13123_c2_g1_i1.p1 TRINITY_DN13123_c2_g1~~TRINITY_DN13123_c2_g1_i1.p1  ORF type:complete len:176 (-),score=17.11 TRINITY_DN13123_c2_g1_i1:297-824(-)
MGDPAKDNRIWANVCEMELQYWFKNQKGKKPHEVMASEGTFFRMPLKGERVRVSGMTRRHDLNGCQGEIISQNVDDCGRVTVRIWTGDDEETSRNMKIQPYRLVANSPAANSTEYFHQDGRASVRSLSRAGSCVSLNSTQSRPLGTAISASAQSALSKTGSQKRGVSTPGGSRCR